MLLPPQIPVNLKFLLPNKLSVFCAYKEKEKNNRSSKMKSFLINEIFLYGLQYDQRVASAGKKSDENPFCEVEKL
jgi:hypothetical protein